MVDNTQVNNGSGDIIRDIDRGGVKTQVVQIDVGGAGGEALASASNPVPVSATALPLPAGAGTAANQASILTALATNHADEVQLHTDIATTLHADLIAPTPAGTNNIGSVTGNVASGAADSGNPLKVGGRYNATLPTLTDGQRGDFQTDPKGRILSANANLYTGGDSFSNAALAGLVAANDGSSGARLLITGGYTFNGTSWDRARSDGINKGVPLVNNPDAGTLAAGTGNASQSAAATLFSIDTSGYNGIAIQITSAGVGCTITYEVSNDNATWYTTGILPLMAGSGGSNTTNAVLLVAANCPGRYFRARVSTYGSGTVTAYYALRRNAFTVGVTSGDIQIANTVGVAGQVASGATDAGNPVKTGAVFNTTLPTVTTGQRVDSQADANGRHLINQPDAGVDSTGTGNASQSAAATLFSIDTSGYNAVAVQITSPGTTCTVTYEGSNDNATWVSVFGYNTNLSAGVAGTSTTALPLVFGTSLQYFRARISTYGSGTVTAYYALRRTQSNANANVQIFGSPSVQTVAKSLLWNTGTSNNGLIASLLTLQSTELNALASASVALSSVGGSSGKFTNANTGAAVYGEMQLILGAIGSALSAGANIAGWFIKSADGGTTFEKSSAAPPRAPDFVIPLPATTISASDQFFAAGPVKLPAVQFKVLLQNNTGQALAATANTLAVAPVAMLD